MILYINELNVNAWRFKFTVGRTQLFKRDTWCFSRVSTRPWHLCFQTFWCCTSEIPQFLNRHLVYWLYWPCGR